MIKTGKELLSERKKRILEVIALKEPDQVPIYLNVSAFGAKYAGITMKEAFKAANLAAWYDINEKLLLEYQPDLFTGPVNFDMDSNTMVGNLMYRWLGNGIGVSHSYQFFEGEYMKAEEYDEFLNNPGDFLF
jgi:hypothetical protein